MSKTHSKSKIYQAMATLAIMATISLGLTPSIIWSGEAKRLRRHGSTDELHHPRKMASPGWSKFSFSKASSPKPDDTPNPDGSANPEGSIDPDSTTDTEDPISPQNPTDPGLQENLTDQAFFDQFASLNRTNYCFAPGHLRRNLEECPPLPDGLAHVAAGVGLRNTGSGSILLRGAPPGATPVAAWLYFVIIDVNPATSLKVLIEDHQVEAIRVVSAPQPCWETALDLEPGAFSTALYRAPVLPSIRKTINGDYRVEGVPTSTEDGSDPLRFGHILPMAQGASLVVVYTDDTEHESSTVYIHEDQTGSPLLIGHLSIKHELDPSLPDWTRLIFTSIGADGQVQDLGESLVPFTTDLGEESALLRIRGPSSIVDAYSDWNGNDGGSFTHFWDTTSTFIDRVMTGDILPIGAETYQVSYNVDTKIEPVDAKREYDCVNVLVHVLSATQPSNASHFTTVQ